MFKNTLLVILVALLGLTTNAQENELTYPVFENCGNDDQEIEYCFQKQVTKLIEENYKENEIATDETYKRTLKATVKVDQKGNFSMTDVDSAESRIFVALKRAIEQLPQVEAAKNNTGETIDFSFTIKTDISRDIPGPAGIVEVKTELGFDSESEEEKN
ncbi:MAG: hypothetical protein ACQESK_01660 [Bacteroidota bacterium]